MTDDNRGRQQPTTSCSGLWRGLTSPLSIKTNKGENYEVLYEVRHIVRESTHPV